MKNKGLGKKYLKVMTGMSREYVGRFFQTSCVLL